MKKSDEKLNQEVSDSKAIKSNIHYNLNLEGENFSIMRDIERQLQKKQNIVPNDKKDFDNGDFYVGETKDNKMHGIGTYYFNDKTKYIGEFINGEIQGYGILFDTEGEIAFDGNMNEFLNIIDEKENQYSSIDNTDVINVIERSFIVGNKLVKTSQIYDQDRMRIISIYINKNKNRKQEILLDDSQEVEFDETDVKTIKHKKKSISELNLDESKISDNKKNNQLEIKKNNKGKKILKYICMILGILFIGGGSIGFVEPFIYPFSTTGNGWYGAALLIPIGFIFLYLYFLDRPLKERLIRVVRILFILITLNSVPGINTITGFMIFGYSILVVVICDNFLNNTSSSKRHKFFNKKIWKYSLRILFLFATISLGIWLSSYVRNLEENKEKAINIIKDSYTSTYENDGSIKDSILAIDKDHKVINDMSIYTALQRISYMGLMNDPNDKISTIKKIQEKLTYEGYYVGEIDGEYGNLTKMAIIDYQNANGLIEDGLMSIELLISLDLISK